ncbi:hypothetical protein K2173_026506 [Erythroxylum novogranatense]|uniref:Uncharacterized protein n=1 Tax=Erythroxylum novogranatense TaxID=1862640 RepID=A0AAV8TZL7_9ROSI|nr:hypothetical protein K2173_026506 [Erythroxylum novogranatense]
MATRYGGMRDDYTVLEVDATMTVSMCSDKFEEPLVEEEGKMMTNQPILRDLTTLNVSQ